DHLRTRPAFGFCGIGNPEAFRRTIDSLGVTIRAIRTFPDHHAYRRADVESLEAWSQTLPADGVVLTTQKDLVKIRVSKLGGRDLWALRIGLQFIDQEARFQQILNETVADQHGRRIRLSPREKQA